MAFCQDDFWPKVAQKGQYQSWTGLVLYVVLGWLQMLAWQEKLSSQVYLKLKLCDNFALNCPCHAICHTLSIPPIQHPTPQAARPVSLQSEFSLCPPASQR